MILIDFVLVNAGFLLAHSLLTSNGMIQYSLGVLNEIVLLASGAVIVIFYSMGLYNKQIKSIDKILRACLAAVISVIIVTMALAFWLGDYGFPRSLLLVGAFVQGLLLFLWHTAHGAIEKKHMKLGDLLVIGSHEKIEKHKEEIVELGGERYRIVKILQDEDNFKDWLDKVDAVLVMPAIPKAKKEHIFKLCHAHGCRVFQVPAYDDLLNS